MSRLFVLLSLFLLLFSVSRAYAQDVVDPNDPSRPDITGWTLMPGSSNISVNVSDNLMYYLGFDLTFQNPNDHSEHVRQVRVLTPFIVVKSNASLDKNYTDAAVAYATDGAEKALLKDYATKSDVILYIRWRVESDIQRGGVDKLVGENEVWFWDATGKWTYGRNLKIDKLISINNLQTKNKIKS